MARFPLYPDPLPPSGFPRPRSPRAALLVAAGLCLSASGCSWIEGTPAQTAAAPAVTITPIKPMVAPTVAPPSEEFNLKAASPLGKPLTPEFSAMPVVEVPPPPTTLEPLPAPAPASASLPALPVMSPSLPAPQSAKPIQPPPGKPADTVSGLETPPPGASAAPAAPLVPAAVETKRQTASLPMGGGTGTGTGAGAAPDITYRLVFPPQSLELPDTAPAVLQHLAATMAEQGALRLKLKSYASGSSDNPVAARRFSMQRALKLREALVALGVSSLRVDVLALGMTAPDAPADRIDIVPAN